MKASDRCIPVFGTDLGRIAITQGSPLCQQASLPRAVAPIAGITRQLSADGRHMSMQKLSYLALGFPSFKRI